MSASMQRPADLLQRWRERCAELEAHGHQSGVPVTLLAVSKYAPDAAVELLIHAGARCFGESRPQQLRDRAARWPACAWHMIGPLQKNKAKYIGRFAAGWHSCDDLDTARAVASHVRGRRLPVWIQVNIGHVVGQHGIAPDALDDFASALKQMSPLQLKGLMCMAPRDGDARLAFRRLRHLKDDLEAAGGVDSPLGLSMGMSGDYRIAMAEGATVVRLGSTLFGDWDMRRTQNDS